MKESYPQRQRASEWYAALARPSWVPPSWLFGPVWSVLYAVIAVSFGTVLYEGLAGMIPRGLLVPFVLNLLFNAAFTPLQFRLKNNLLAMLDVLLVVLTLVWALVSVRPYLPWVAYANLPYLAWTCFATVLQVTITWMNRGVRPRA